MKRTVTIGSVLALALISGPGVAMAEDRRAVPTTCTVEPASGTGAGTEPSPSGDTPGGASTGLGVAVPALPSIPPLRSVHLKLSTVYPPPTWPGPSRPMPTTSSRSRC